MISTKEIEKARARLHHAIDKEMDESTVLRLSQELDTFVVEFMKTQKAVQNLPCSTAGSRQSRL